MAVWSGHEIEYLRSYYQMEKWSYRGC